MGKLLKALFSTFKNRSLGKSMRAKKYNKKVGEVYNFSYFRIFSFNDNLLFTSWIIMKPATEVGKKMVDMIFKKQRILV